MTLKHARTALFVAILAPLAALDAVHAQDTRAAERDCLDTVEDDYRPRGRLRVVSSEWAQAGTQVVVEADGERWTCIADDRGDVWDIDAQGSSGGHGYDRDDDDGGDWDDDDHDRYPGGDGAGVTLYRDTEFRGTSETFRDNVSYLGDTRIGNDELSSIRIPSGCRVWLFRDANYEGRSVELDSDERELGRTAMGNDEASSMEVECRGGGHGYDDDDDDGYGHDRGVTLYSDSEFRGTSITLYGDERYLGDTRIGNDEVSSVRVSSGCRAWLYADSEFRGHSLALDRDERYLGDTRIGNDSVSSIQVNCR